MDLTLGRQEVECRWHQLAEAGDTSPGDVVGSQELELCLLLKGCG